MMMCNRLTQVTKAGQSNATRLHALFFFSAPSYFNEGFGAVEAFIQAGWRTTAVFEWCGESAVRAASACQSAGCEIVKLPEALTYRMEQVSRQADSAPVDRPSVYSTGRRRIFQLTVQYLPPLARLAEVFWSIPRLLKLRRFGRDFLRAIAPDVVSFGPFNSYGRAANAVFAAAKLDKIPIVCIPFATFMGQSYQVLERFESQRRGNIGLKVRADYDLFNRICALLFRSWTRVHNGTRLFHRDPVELITGRLLGLNLTDGWTKPSPYFDRVFVPCQHSIDRLSVDGFPMERLVLSGMPRMDTIIKTLSSAESRRTFFDSIHLPVDTKYVVVNVEPAAEHYVATWEEHWRYFRATLRVASSLNMPVVLSLHPLCKLENYLFAEQEFGAIVRHPRNIYELVAHSTMVISSVCSTLLPTQMFGKPTVIYDYLNVPPEVAAFFDLDKYAVCKDAEALERECRKMAASLSTSGVQQAADIPLASEIIRREVELLVSAARRAQQTASSH